MSLKHAWKTAKLPNTTHKCQELARMYVNWSYEGRISDINDAYDHFWIDLLMMYLCIVLSYKTNFNLIREQPLGP